MTGTITKTNLWKQTLASREEDDPAEDPRERLRSIFTGFRKRVSMLANEIHRDLPNYTVHDITHIDALWEMADIITDGEYPMNPAETFVFGGAVLLHDVGMSLAAYPDGLDSLRDRPEWEDLVAEQFENVLGHCPSQDEVNSPPENITRKATAHLLRELHAKRAAELATTSWKSAQSDDSQFLIEDNEIRQAFGQTIGRVAHSHWWPISRVELEFSRPLGAPYWCPNGWDIDLLKIACLLRVSDASHLDARRAPSFLRSLRKPGPYSDSHWKFQENLQKPYLEEDALAFTSGYSFTIEDAASWWLSLETLKMVDKELRQTDALLADKGLPRFKARRVAGVDSPERLVSYIPTDNWLPIDATVQISDLPRVIENMGGAELYGHKPQVPLRELIQNASDAVRARRFVEDRDISWGSIIVRLGKEDRYWLEVSDTGIGMSTDVLTDYLLDFGSTYWNSGLMRSEYPGLRSSNFEAVGEYGIGFFSIFMLGESVQIKTRQSNAAQADTMVMEFNTGPSSRPILRDARQEEQLIEGGTTVRVWMEQDPYQEGGLLYRKPDKKANYTLENLCKILCPSLDVNVFIEDQEKDQPNNKLVHARDWTQIDGSEVFERVESLRFPTNLSTSPSDVELNKEFRANAASNLREIINPNGETVGRACIAASTSYHTKDYYPNLYGVVTVGGLKACSLNNIAGILVGEVERVSRDAARPVVHPDALAEWATEQSSLVPDLYEESEMQAFCALVIRICGGDTGELPICKRQGKWLTFDDIVSIDWKDRVFLINDYFVRNADEHNRSISLYKNVVVGRFSSRPVILHGEHSGMSWPISRDEPWWTQTMIGAVIEALAAAWDTAPKTLYTSGAETRVPRTIGIEGGEKVEAKATVISRPDGR